MRPIFEDIGTGEIIYLNVASSTDVETNIVMYGVDKAGETTTPKAGVYPDPLNTGMSGKEEFVDIKETKSTPWKLTTQWLMKSLDDAGFSPMMNPDMPELRKTMLGWKAPNISKTRNALATLGKLRSHYSRCRQCWESGTDSRGRMAAAAEHTKMAPDGDEEDPERAAELARDAVEVSREVGDDEDEYVFSNESDLRLQPLGGDQGYEILVGDKSKKNKLRREMKAGVRYVIEILTAPGLSEGNDGNMPDVTVATNKLFEILKSSAPSWAMIELDDHDINISARTEEIGYPNRVYLGPDWEQVAEEEKSIKQFLSTYAGSFSPDKIRFSHLPNAESAIRSAARELGCEPTEEAIKQTIKDKIAKLQSVYDQAEKEGMLVDPHTRAGRAKVKEYLSQAVAANRQAGAKRGAETKTAKHQPRWNKEFEKHIERIMGEGNQFGIPPGYVSQAIMVYLRKVAGISSVDEFTVLPPLKKQEIIKKLKALRYINLHGIWESMRRLAVAKYHGDVDAIAICEENLNKAIAAIPIPENGIELKVAQLAQYISQIEHMKKYIYESAGLYAALLDKAGHGDNIVDILGAYQLEYVEPTQYEIEIAEAIIDAEAIVSEARSLFAQVVNYVGAENAHYIERLTPTGILDDDGYIDDSTFVESTKKAGVNIAKVYLSENISRVRQQFLESVT